MGHFFLTGVSKMEVESIDNPRIHLPRDKRQKALELLGTTESKITLMKTLGMSASEVESAIAEVELANTARCREKNDQAILNKVNSKKDSKCLDRLGINLSIPRLQKQFGISEEELELAFKEVEQCRIEKKYSEDDDEDLQTTPRGSICAAEKIAIVDSAKLQKLFGVDSKIVRLMHILGASEEELLDGFILMENLLISQKVKIMTLMKRN